MIPMAQLPGGQTFEESVMLDIGSGNDHRRRLIHRWVREYAAQEFTFTASKVDDPLRSGVPQGIRNRLKAPIVEA